MTDKTENKLMEEIKQLEKQKGLSIVNVTALITKKERLKQHRETRKEFLENEIKDFEDKLRDNHFIITEELLEKLKKEMKK